MVGISYYKYNALFAVVIDSIAYLYIGYTLAILAVFTCGACRACRSVGAVLPFSFYSGIGSAYPPVSVISYVGCFAVGSVFTVLAVFTCRACGACRSVGAVFAILAIFT